MVTTIAGPVAGDHTHGRFTTDGYAVLPIFDPMQVQDAQTDIVGLIDRLSHAFYWPFEASCPDAPLATRLDCIREAEPSQANLLRLAICSDAHRGPRLQAMAQSLALRTAAEVLSGRRLDGQVVRVRASIGAFPEHLHDWHSDVAIDDGSDCGRVAITAWIPLCDVVPGRAGLEIIPGHRSTPFPHRRDKGFAIDEAQLAGLPRARPACPLGSAIFLDRFTPHRSLPADGDARFALVVWMKLAAA